MFVPCNFVTHNDCKTLCMHSQCREIELQTKHTDRIPTACPGPTLDCHILGRNLSYTNPFVMLAKRQITFKKSFLLFLKCKYHFVVNVGKLNFKPSIQIMYPLSALGLILIFIDANSSLMTKGNALSLRLCYALRNRNF